MKDFVEKIFSYQKEKNYYWQESLKSGEKRWVAASRKICFSKKEYFLKIEFRLISNHGFHKQKQKL